MMGAIDWLRPPAKASLALPGWEPLEGGCMVTVQMQC